MIIIITNNITHNSIIKPLLCYYTACKYCQNAAYFLLILAYTTLKPQIAHTGRFGILVPYKLTLLSNMLPDTSARKTVLVPYKFTLLSNLKFASKCENGTTTARFDRHGDCTVTCVKSEFTQIRIYCYSFFKWQTLILSVFNHKQAVFVINAGFHE